MLTILQFDFGTERNKWDNLRKQVNRIIQEHLQLIVQMLLYYYTSKIDTLTLNYELYRF